LVAEKSLVEIGSDQHKEPDNYLVSPTKAEHTLLNEKQNPQK